MTYIYVDETHSIRYNKKDKISSSAGEAVAVSLLIVCGFTVVAPIVLFGIGIGGYIAPILFLISIFAMGGLVVIHISMEGCGIEIDLLYGSEIVETYNYRFTQDPELDAKKIQDAITNMKKTASIRTEARKKREQERIESEKACCDIYRNVMKKVEENNG